MQTIDLVCGENAIPYYLFYGTELGAVRHSGFIPWDDDVDIVMYRKDFEAFRACWLSMPPEGYFFQDIHTDANYNLKIVKIRKDHTALVETPYKDVKMHHGIWVDIFILDDYVKNGFLRRLGEWITMFDYNAVRNYRPEGKRGLFYRVTNRVFRGGGIYRFWYRRIFPGLKKDEEMCSDITSFTFSHHYDFRREWFGKAKLLSFEGVLLPVPADTDKTLRVCYGDYMTLPPPEKRISNHHPFYYSAKEDYFPGTITERSSESGDNI